MTIHKGELDGFEARGGMHWSNKREGQEDAAVGCFVQRWDCCEALK